MVIYLYCVVNLWLFYWLFCYIKKKIKLLIVLLFNVKEVISFFCMCFFLEFVKSDCVKIYVKNNCIMVF